PGLEPVGSRELAAGVPGRLDREHAAVRVGELPALGERRGRAGGGTYVGVPLIALVALVLLVCPDDDRGWLAGPEQSAHRGGVDDRSAVQFISRLVVPLDPVRRRVDRLDLVWIA